MSSMGREQTSGFAAAVSYDTSRVRIPQFGQCSLCSEQSSDHPLFKCKKFSTPRDKTDELKAVGGCIKCGYTNHKTADCRFKFSKPCVYCKASNLSFLCLARTKYNCSQNLKINNNSVSVNCNNTYISNCTILPTFSFTLSDGYKEH